MRGALPRYPPYRRSGDRAHRVVRWGDGPWQGSLTYAGFLALALDPSTDVLCDAVLAWPLLADAVEDPHANVYAVPDDQSGTYRIAGIAWRVGNRYCNLVEADAWPDAKNLVELVTQTNAALNIGTYSTPSSLGQASIQATLTKSYKTLAASVLTDVRSALAGGRAELPEPWRGEAAYEIDRRMAYVAEARKPLPIGAAEVWYGPDPPPERYPKWLAQCVIYIPRVLLLGPFCVRRGLQLTYPTQPGSYEDVWLTEGEYADTIAAGCTVIVRRAWVWRQAEPVLAPWADQIYQARLAADDATLAEAIKQVAVAAIGRFAIRPGRGRVVRWHPGQPGQILLNAGGRATAYVVTIEPDAVPAAMPHWALWIWAEARRTLYHRQLAEIDAGNTVLMSNFDSLVLEKPTHLPLAPGELGEWRQQVHTHVQLDQSRWLVSDQVDKRPGLERVKR